MNVSTVKIKLTLKLDIARTKFLNLTKIIKLRFTQEQEPWAFFFLLPVSPGALSNKRMFDESRGCLCFFSLLVPGRVGRQHTFNK